MPLRSPFKLLGPKAPRREPHVPAGQRLYAVGDIHGRFDLLLDLLVRIKADNSARPTADTRLIFLGDLIDRGPASADVIEYLMSYKPRWATFHFIMGNHEEAMLRSFEPGHDLREIGWLSYGGLETLRSYHVPPDRLDLSRALRADDLRAYVPAEHFRFIASFSDMLRFGDYLFVHAGIRPAVPLENQRPEDLRWIRREFLEDRRDHGCVVVHGHTISREPEILHNRIGIDTGAYFSGVLTAVGLEGADRWLLATPGAAELAA